MTTFSSKRPEPTPPRCAPGSAGALRRGESRSGLRPSFARRAYSADLPSPAVAGGYAKAGGWKRASTFAKATADKSRRREAGSGLRDPSSAVALLRRVEGGRPDWDTYFMDITQVVKRRSNCRRRQVAAIIVNQRRIISTGYNGTPSGIKNCNEGGCPRCASDAPTGEQLGDCICAHAEENAIVQAAYYGVPLKDSMLYCTDSPCLLCAKMIITAGIKEVVYENKYHYSRQVAALFAEAGVRCRRFIRGTPPSGRTARTGRKRAG